MEVLARHESKSHSESSVWKSVFSCFLWFCLGILAAFGLKIHDKAAKVFMLIFKLNPADTISFGFNFEIISVALYFSGLLLAYIFFPVSLIWLEILLYLTLFMFLGMIIPSHMLVKNSTALSRDGIKYFFYITNAGASLGIGAITMIGMALITDRFVPGKTPMKLMFHLLGYPLGEIAAIFSEFLGRFTVYDELMAGLGANLAKFLTYKMSIILVLVLMTSIMIIFFTKFNDSDHRIWMKFNAINKSRILFRGLRRLSGQIKCIIVLLISSSLSGIFSVVSLLYLMSIYTAGDDVLLGRAKLLLFKCAFDFLGRLVSGLVGLCVERARTSTRENQENQSVAKKVICCIFSPMLLVFILVIVEVVIIMITASKASNDSNALSSPWLSHKTGIFVSSFVGLVAGLTASLVFSRGSNVNVNKGLIDDDVLMVDDVNLVRSFVLGVFLLFDCITIILIKILKLYIEGVVQNQQARAGQPPTLVP